MNAEMPIPGIAEADQLAASGKRVDAETAYVRAIHASRSPEALNKYAQFLKQEERLETALKNFEEAIQRSPAATPAKAEAYRGAGSIFQQLHDFVQAQESYEAALAIDNLLDLEDGLAEDYRALGQLALDRGRLDVAQTQFRRALTIDSDRGDQRGITADKNGLGNVLLKLNVLDQAQKIFEGALETSVRLDSHENAAKAYLGLASVAEKRSPPEWRRAVDFYDRAVHMLALTGELKILADAQLRGGIAWLNIDEPGVDVPGIAAKRVLGARMNYEDLDYPNGAARASIYLAEALRRDGKFQEAEQELLRAIKLYEKLEDRTGLATAYHQLGRVYREKGSSDRARSMWAFARSLYLHINDTAGAAEIERLLATEIEGV
jgi:tetratricopeptide (TPR) repeat protein